MAEHDRAPEKRRAQRRLAGRADRPGARRRGGGRGRDAPRQRLHPTGRPTGRRPTLDAPGRRDPDHDRCRRRPLVGLDLVERAGEDGPRGRRRARPGGRSSRRRASTSTTCGRRPDRALEPGDLLPRTATSCCARARSAPASCWSLGDRRPRRDADRSDSARSNLQRPGTDPMCQRLRRCGTESHRSDRRPGSGVDSATPTRSGLTAGKRLARLRLRS